jgi:hypothetical protein
VYCLLPLKQWVTGLNSNWGMGVHINFSVYMLSNVGRDLVTGWYTFKWILWNIHKQDLTIMTVLARWKIKWQDIGVAYCIYIYIYFFFFMILTHQISSNILHRMCYYKEVVKYHSNLFTIGIFKLQWERNKLYISL